HPNRLTKAPPPHGPPRRAHAADPAPSTDGRTPSSRGRGRDEDRHRQREIDGSAPTPPGPGGPQGGGRRRQGGECRTEGEYGDAHREHPAPAKPVTDRGPGR